jgi:hypothetical protein
MAKNNIEFQIFLREPKYPIIVISEDKLMSAYNINELAKCCLNAKKSEKEKLINAIDAAGKEFWYSQENHVISPGFTMKKWTKKNIILLHNNMATEDNKYSEKSLSSKRLEKIIADICDLNKQQKA